MSNSKNVRAAIALTTLALTATLLSFLTIKNEKTLTKELEVLPVTRSIQLPSKPEGEIKVTTESGKTLDGVYVIKGNILVMPPLYTGEVLIKYKGYEIKVKAGDPALNVGDIQNCPGNKLSEVLCLLANVDSLVKEKGATKARDELYDYMMVNRETAETCSMVAYALAYSASEQVGVEKAAALDAQFCRFSYLHGLGSYAVLTGLSIDEQKKICELEMVGMDKSTVTIQCSHGLGHGYYIQNKYKVEDTQKYCEKLESDEISKSACYEGVFMLEMELSKPYFLIFANHKEPAGYPLRTRPKECIKLITYDARHGCFRYAMRLEALDWRGSLEDSNAHLPKYDQEREKFISDMIEICVLANTEEGECQYGLGEALWQSGREYKSSEGDTLDKRFYPRLVEACTMWDLEQAEQCASRLVSNVASELADISLASKLCDIFVSKGLKNTCTAGDRGKWLTMVNSTKNIDPRVAENNHSGKD